MQEGSDEELDLTADSLDPEPGEVWSLHKTSVPRIDTDAPPIPKEAAEHAVRETGAFKAMQLAGAGAFIEARAFVCEVRPKSSRATRDFEIGRD
jgi:hypothetical protein